MRPHGVRRGQGYITNALAAYGAYKGFTGIKNVFSKAKTGVSKIFSGPKTADIGNQFKWRQSEPKVKATVPFHKKVLNWFGKKDPTVKTNEIELQDMSKKGTMPERSTSGKMFDQRVGPITKDPYPLHKDYNVLDKLNNAAKRVKQKPLPEHMGDFPVTTPEGDTFYDARASGRRRGKKGGRVRKTKKC